MYVFIPNKRERDLKGKTYIELDSASTNNMLYSNAFDDMYIVLNRYNYAMIEICIFIVLNYVKSFMSDSILFISIL